MTGSAVLRAGALCCRHHWLKTDEDNGEALALSCCNPSKNTINAHRKWSGSAAVSFR